MDEPNYCFRQNIANISLKVLPMDEPNYCFRQNIANISLKVLPMDGLDIDQNRNILQCQGIYA